jgi:SAM-dependent methyltransferase
MKEHYLHLIDTHPFLKGTSRLCNICGYRFSTFLPFNGRNDAMCPVCFSLERHRHLYIHLLILIPFMIKRNILHFAPEIIIKKIFTLIDVQYFDADIDKEKATHIQDITKITFNNESFEYVIAIHVLEHIVDDMKALSEIKRILKINGTALLSVPLYDKLFEDYEIISPADREKFFGQSDHVRRYDETTFCSRIKENGFSISISKPNFFPKLLQEECRLGDTIIVATKR